MYAGGVSFMMMVLDMGGYSGSKVEELVFYADKSSKSNAKDLELNALVGDEDMCKAPGCDDIHRHKRP